jgi:SAM-dependent methyltransferase
MRNREPILEVLRRILPEPGLVLEVGSGTGEHAAYFATAMPGLIWQPSDSDPALRESIAAHAEACDAANLAAPLDLDTTSDEWPVAAADAVVSINMIHIAPWTCSEGLVRGAARILPPHGPLYLYGPFMRDGRHTAPSNATFDRSLRAEDPRWGVRDVAEVAALAAGHGLALDEITHMPSNNLSVVFRKVESPA